MIRRVLLSLVLLAILVFALPGPALAADGLSVLDTPVEINFPGSIVFNISATGDSEIRDIRLDYTVERQEFARVVSEVIVPFEPGTSVTTQWTWDMRQTGGLPPGTSVDFWWKVTDAGGGEIETAPQRITVEDDRFNWNSITEGMIKLYWYEGDDSFGQELMDAVQAALLTLAENTGAELESAVSFYIYATSADLLGSMIFPQEWTGGVTFYQYGVIAITIGTSQAELDWGKRTIKHELTHMVVHQVTANPYSSLPTWLDEGLATASEGDLEPYLQSVLNGAIALDTLISVQSLASPFSAYPGEAYLAYAESYKVVSYLLDEYGRDDMLELLQVFAGGAGYDEALREVYDLDTETLDTSWKEYFEIVPGTGVPTVTVTLPAAAAGIYLPPVVIGLIAGVLAGLLLLVALLVENLNWRLSRK